MGKGEIARYGQFFLFPHCFQKAFSQGRQKVSLCGNGLREKKVVSQSVGQAQFKVYVQMTYPQGLISHSRLSNDISYSQKSKCTLSLYYNGMGLEPIQFEINSIC